MTERTGVHGGDSRPRTIPIVILMLTLVVGMGAGAALVHAYDPRIDEAVQALQKAAALTEAASAGNVSARTQRRFDRHIDKALECIEEAMGHIVAAGVAADSDAGQ